MSERPSVEPLVSHGRSGQGTARLWTGRRRAWETDWRAQASVGEAGGTGQDRIGRRRSIVGRGPRQEAGLAVDRAEAREASRGDWRSSSCSMSMSMSTSMSRTCTLWRGSACPIEGQQRERLASDQRRSHVHSWWTGVQAVGAGPYKPYEREWEGAERHEKEWKEWKEWREWKEWGNGRHTAYRVYVVYDIWGGEGRKEGRA